MTPTSRFTFVKSAIGLSEFSLTFSAIFDMAADRYLALRLYRALGDRLGCTLSLAAEITKTAGRRDSMEKGGNDYGDAEFIDVGGALLATGRLLRIKVDGPFGAPAEDVFKSEGESSGLRNGENGRADERRVGSRDPHRHWHWSHAFRFHPQEHLARCDISSAPRLTLT